MTIDQTSGTRLGMDLSSCHELQCLLVDDVISGGLVDAWNIVNPLCCVKPGDQIIEVNDVRRDCNQLVGALRDGGVLSIWPFPFC